MEISFRKLRARDVACLMPFFGQRSNLTCDSTIFDSFLWQDYFALEFAVWENSAVFFRLWEEGRRFYTLPVCDEETLPAAFAALESWAQEHREPGEEVLFRWADENALKILALPEEQYRITEEEDLADYIYEADKLRTLAGKKYHKKKNHLNAFLKEYEGRWEYRKLHRWSRTEIWSFLEQWEQNKTDVEEHLEAEMTGLHHYLFNMDLIDATMAGIYIDGRLEAFTIGSYNAFDRMSIVHVEKANGEIRGLYTLINQQFQTHEFPEAQLVNREDDVGIPSLRKAKESYHPVMRARKYEIRRV